MAPIITVVTVCYNSASTIQRTLESVLVQDLSGIEYLIIDGASTDSTIEIINCFEDRYDGALRLISEHDNGWYDAMNKAIQSAEGNFIVFLNSDDYFDKDALSIVKNVIKTKHLSNDCIIYGDSTNIYQNSKGNVLYRRINAPDQIDPKDRGLRKGMCGIRHQSMFTGKGVFNSVGGLDLQYRLHADWDFLIRCVKKGIPMYHIPQNLTYYSMNGVSTKSNYNERHELRKNNGLYDGIDWDYIRDRWGLKTTAKRIFGEKRWNDILFSIHEKRESSSISLL